MEHDALDEERDYCIPDDFYSASDMIYVSLIHNPERFTGYAGPHAHSIWREIYKRNCFTVDSSNKQETDNCETIEELAHSNIQSAKSNIAGLFESPAGYSNAWESDEVNRQSLLKENTCLEKRVFFRIISGMHASISTHLCWNYLNQSTGEWGPNLECYKERLESHPERIENIYFNYIVVLRALAKLKNFVPNYVFCAGDPVQDAITKEKMIRLTNTAAALPKTFDESVMFDPAVDPDARGLKCEFRARFRNVSAVMDCVGCDKCRLWGKIQTAGYGTALKILFEFDEEKPEEAPSLRKIELVALVNTLARLSDSISAIQSFKRLLAEENELKESENLISLKKKEELAQRESEELAVRERVELAIKENEELALKESEEIAKKKFKELTPRERFRASLTQQSFKGELATVWAAYCYVFKSYARIPRVIWTYILYYANYAWDAAFRSKVSILNRLDL